ncbi:MAG: ParA family protein [Endozoicomonadaceae bacterium]|nr:ParA family protein [Endozoicomonadaceae bacterium]
MTTLQNKTNQNLLENITNLGYKLESSELDRIEAVLENTKTEDEISALIEHHSVPQTIAAKICGMTTPTFKEKVKLAIEEGVIPTPTRTRNKLIFTLQHIHALLEWLGRPKWTDKNLGCVVTTCQNQKGGTGKTTATVSLATSIALELQHRARVLMIDLDPQGSIKSVAIPDPSEHVNMISCVDLMLHDVSECQIYERAKNQFEMSHEEIVKASVVPTHIPNLDVIPAFPEDERFSAIAYESGHVKNYIQRLNDYVIDYLRADYDFIFIDCGPFNNPLVWSAMEAANSILIPVSPRNLDWLSTSTFIKALPNKLAALPSKGSKLRYFKVGVVNYDDEMSRDFRMLDIIKTNVGNMMLNNQCKRSTAFEAASRNFCTIFDFKISDGHCSRLQYKKAHDSVTNFTNEYLLGIQDAFDGNGE